MLELRNERHDGQDETTPSHSVQTHRCRHGSNTTEATRFPQALQPGPLTNTTRSGSTYADSASSTSSTAHRCPTPSRSAKLLPTLRLTIACSSCDCNATASSSCALALASQTCASALRCAARASSSMLRRFAFSTSVSFSFIRLMIDDSAARSSEQ
ncbi:hypothetical protein HanIR_Chr03g0142721 [Helianthus annuus]|nr:hypothetical protein HanIR_Chr03g0142721 [Helianthus annuus]